LTGNKRANTFSLISCMSRQGWPANSEEI